ncbi:MAG: GNAT family N-acetyltransferase [Gammaproteobacteria bacterium]
MAEKIIEKLATDHDVAPFDCGEDSLNRYLAIHALSNQKAGSAATYIAREGNNIIGYYSLAVGSIIHASAPDRVTKGLTKHPVPVMLLARLAVDVTVQSQDVGRGLLKDALLRTVQAADIAGIRALLVHAKDLKAKQWYQQFDFEESPTDPLHRFLLLKDIKKALA